MGSFMSSNPVIKEEGSVMDRVVESKIEVKVPNNQYMAPLLDTNTCPIIDIMPINLLEQVFTYLPISSLSIFSSTNSYINSAIGEYLKHQCRALQQEKSIQNLKDTAAHNLFTSIEKQILNQVSSQRQFEDVRKDMYNILNSISTLLPWKRDRVSCTEERVWIPHKGTGHYIRVTHDDVEERDVVHLKTVCWLQISTSWPNILPGTYIVSLRMKLLHDFSWPHDQDQKSLWRVDVDDTDKIKIKVGRDWWRMLNQNKTPADNEGNKLRVHWENPTEAGGWVRVSLPDIVVKEKGSVNFEFNDVECRWWKGGIIFDFIELQNIN